MSQLSPQVGAMAGDHTFTQEQIAGFQPHTIENLFECLWEERDRHAADLIAAGERDLGRVLGLVAERYRTHSLLAVTVSDSSGQRQVLTGKAEWVPIVVDAGDRNRYPDGLVLPTGMPLYAWTFVGGQRTVQPALASHDNLVVPYVLDVLASESFDAVVEIGSGLGERLFEIYLGGGPADIPYFGAELWESGRRAAERLAELDPRLDYRSIAFDLKNPDFTFLSGFRRVLILTNGTICAVEHVHPHLVDKMAVAAESVTSVHFEFIGHQVAPPVPGCDSYYDLLRREKFNVDFLPLLAEAQRRGVVEAQAVLPDVYAVSSGHFQSIVHWTSGGEGDAA